MTLYHFVLWSFQEKEDTLWALRIPITPFRREVTSKDEYSLFIN